MIAVSATNSSDQRWPLSNYGDYIDVAAPGHFIYSTYHDLSGTNGYASMSGTSMAAPFVSGLAALVVSRQPGLTGDEVAAMIANRADDIGDPGKDVYFGSGRINTYATLVAANDNVKPPPDGTTGTIANPIDDPLVTHNIFLAMVTVAN